MDISAGGLAPSSRDGGAVSASADPVDQLLSPLGSPVFPSDPRSKAAWNALQGGGQAESDGEHAVSLGEGDPAASTGAGTFNPPRRKTATRVYGSKGARKQETALEPISGDGTPRTISRSGQRYFDNPPTSGKGAPNKAMLAAKGFYSTPGGKAAVSLDPASDSLPQGQDSVPGATPSLNFYGGSPPKPSEGAAGGPSQLAADSNADSNADAPSMPPSRSPRFDLTKVRKIADLDRFASEAGLTTAAAQGDNDDRFETLSEFSYADTASRYAATDDGMTIRSGYKRAFSEIQEADEEEGEAARSRYRRSDTPFNESEFPEDEAASFVSGSRFAGRRQRSRSVAFSQYSLFSERSRDDDDAVAEPAALDSGFYGVGEQGDVKTVGTGATFEAETSSQTGDGPYLDPLTPIPVLYASAKHPFLAYAAALAQAAEGADANKRVDEGQAQQPDQENVAPTEIPATQKEDDRPEDSIAILTKWETAQKGAAGQFSDLIARVDQLLQSKVTRHGELRSTLHSHASNLNERFAQLEQTKKGLRDWGGQLFGGYMNGLEPHGQVGPKSEEKDGSATSASKAEDTAGGGQPVPEGDLQETAIIEVVPDSAEEA